MVSILHEWQLGADLKYPGVVGVDLSANRWVTVRFCVIDFAGFDSEHDLTVVVAVGTFGAKGARLELSLDLAPEKVAEPRKLVVLDRDKESVGEHVLVVDKGSSHSLLPSCSGVAGTTAKVSAYTSK